MQKPFSIPGPDAAAFEGLALRAGRIGIVTHTRPDGDAIGSCLALKRYLEARLGGAGNCRILLDTDAPDAVRFLFSPSDLQETLVYERDAAAVREWVEGCTLLVFLDLNTLSRTGGMEEALRGSAAPRILVDHHLHPNLADFGLAFSEMEVSSTCELLYRILRALPSCEGKGLPEGCAEPLLTGITTDTNNFANSVYGGTLETVAELLEAGVDRERILEHVYNEYPERRIRLLGRLLDRELTISDKGVACMILDGETAAAYGIKEGETEGFVNIPLAIDRVRMSLFLKQSGDEYRISIRSKKGWSARDLAARYFAGGGHEQASGGRIPLGGDLKTKDDVAAFVARCTDEFLTDES
jgi:phosphoesterase RecJ-like protein